jgi:hypothetical protein
LLPIIESEGHRHMGAFTVHVRSAMVCGAFYHIILPLDSFIDNTSNIKLAAALGLKSRLIG